MDLELGVVCGRCESYSVLGTATCTCGNVLALEVASPVSAPASGSKLPPTTQRTPPEPPPPPQRLPREEPNVPPSAPRLPPSRPEPSPAPVSARPKSKPEPTKKKHSSVPREEPKETKREDPRAEPIAGSARKSTPPPPPVSVGSGERITLSRDDDEKQQISEPPRSKGDSAPSAASSPPKSSKQSKSVEELMDQAKNFVCRSCSTPVPMGHKFCGRCGAAVPPEILNSRTQFFGQLQAPGKAKLILIRGEGVEGLSYQLNADQHVVGRLGQLVFPDDPFVSPKHANFFYRAGKLVVRDEGSLNGVYLRVRGTIEINPGDHFLAGEQVFQVNTTPKLNDQPGPDGTYFYSSPKHQSPFRIVQVLHGGAPGMTVCARGPSLQIGREGGDLNFPSDLYMSASHCRLEDQAGKLMLTDLNSRNGSYIRLAAERELAHGDYLFIGRKLLRVEITAAA